MLRALVVTAQHRVYGPAAASWLRALAAAKKDLPGARLDHVMQYGNPSGLTDPHDIVTAKHREMRQVFLAGSWEVFISIEDDMVIPTDTFTRLWRCLETGADIVYGLYVWRHGGHEWSAYTRLDEHSGTSLSGYPGAARQMWGQVIEVQGIGMGCTAISRETLKRLDFRRAGSACDDWGLALDAQRHNRRQVADLGLVCGHMTLDPSPRILWPDPEAEGLMRVQPLDPPASATLTGVRAAT